MPKSHQQSTVAMLCRMSRTSLRARRCRDALLAFSMVFGVIGPANAQSCTISAANGAYGVVDILSGAVDDTSTTFTASCTGTASQTVRLCVEMGPGSETDASGNRVLRTGSNDLLHELYTNSGRTTIWGSWGYSIATYTPYPFGVTYDLALGGGGSANHTFTVYGRVQANQQTNLP